MDTVGEQRKLQKNEVEEIRNEAYESTKIYKEKTKVNRHRVKFFYSTHTLSYFQVSYVPVELDL